MKKIFIFIISFYVYFPFLFGAETIVFVRHAEKPEGGLGQITCQGLNRALRLPNVLEKKFGKPSAIFTSNPAEQKADSGVLYSYVRPLATIEPTAVRFGLPIYDKYGFKDVSAIVGALSDEKYKNSTIFVAWEHHLLVEIVKTLLSADKSIMVPKWDDRDFDSIYVVEIDRDKHTYKLRVDKQGLNGLPTECP